MALFSRCVPEQVQPYAGQVFDAAHEFGVPPAILAGLVMQESDGDAQASNFSQYRYGELLAELQDGTLPAALNAALSDGWTVRELATSIGLTEVEGDTAWETLHAHYPYTRIFGPSLDLRLGAKYLARMKVRFPTWREALAAYNAGPTAVQDGTAPASSFDTYAANILAWQQEIEACMAGKAG